MLKNNRIELQLLNEDDMPRIWSWHELFELRLFDEYKPHFSFDHLRNGFSEFLGPINPYLICSGMGDELGICTFQEVSWKNRACEVSLQIFTAASNDPLPKDALILLSNHLFLDLNMEILSSMVCETDYAEIKAFEEAGFYLEGRLREHFFRDGVYTAACLYQKQRNRAEFPEQ